MSTGYRSRVLIAKLSNRARLPVLAPVFRGWSRSRGPDDGRVGTGPDSLLIERCVTGTRFGFGQGRSGTHGQALKRGVAGR